MELSYGYSYSNLWRNFGIVCAFAVAFISVLLAFTEWNTASALEVGSTMFVRSKKGKGAVVEAVVADKPVDEEKSSGSGGATPATVTATATGSPVTRSTTAQERELQEKALKNLEATPDLFSWQDLVYTVPVGKGETRRLLDQVSGYVSPGKLTALMGESGAGKVSFGVHLLSLSFLARLAEL